jgi:putative aldouronate transport system substrate-binding protein
MEMAFYFPGAASDALLAQKALQKAVPLSEPNPTLGLVSQTAINRAPALSQLNTDYQNGIIMGNRSIKDMKAWRDRWRDTGGDKMRSEYEDSLARTS